MHATRPMGVDGMKAYDLTLYDVMCCLLSDGQASHTWGQSPAQQPKATNPYTHGTTQLLDLFVRALFDPKTRLNTTERRAAAAKLLAVASTALLDGTLDKGEAEELREDLHEASDLLADEATLHWNMATSATPAALKRLLARPVVAMGFLHWLRATIQDPEFHNARQFNEVMAVFMRLLQHLIVSRPLHQPAVFAALRALLRLKPTESSFQIIRMKRQALQCCVFLMSHVRACVERGCAMPWAVRVYVCMCACICCNWLGSPQNEPSDVCLCIAKML
jgi:hypothetical protein